MAAKTGLSFPASGVWLIAVMVVSYCREYLYEQEEFKHDLIVYFMLSQHLVAIAGSAGSFEVLKKIFDRTPLDNSTYVILRHLPYNYRSSLDVLLRRHTKLAVLEAQQGAPVLKNTVYYAPLHHDIAIKDGTFDLVPRNQNMLNRAVDIFLLSLAKNENKQNAIVVILSGIGKDGLAGTKAIKDAGGLVIVQAPESCDFSGMPQQIIDQGLADFVLQPEDMPPVIQGYANMPRQTNTMDM